MTVRTGRWGEWTVAAVVALVIGWPLLNCVLLAILGDRPEQAGANWDGLVTSSVLLGNTLRVVGLTIFFAVPLGSLLAWLLVRTDLPGSRGWVAVLVVQAMVPLPLQALGWLGGYGNLGRQQAIGSVPWLTGWPAASLVYAVSVLPWVVLIVGAGLRATEPGLEEQARLHWPAWKVVTHVHFGRSWGMILAASVLTAAVAATDMTVTDLIPVRTFAEESYLLSQLGLDQVRLILRATMPQLLVIGLVVGLMATWFSRLDLARLADSHRPLWRMGLGRARFPIAHGVAILAALLVGLPLYALVWRAGRVGPGSGLLSWSFQGFLGSLGGAWQDLLGGSSSGIRAPLPGSILWSGIAATGSVALAWGLVLLSRVSRWWRATTLAVFVIGLATPGPIVGLAIKLAYAGTPTLNRTPVLLVIGLIVRSLPYSLAVAGPTLWSWPRAWDEEANLAGLGLWRQARLLVLPLTASGMAIAWLLAFVQAMGELPASYLTYAPGYDLVSLLVWSLLHMGVESRLAAIGLILFGLTVIPAVGILFLATRFADPGKQGPCSIACARSQ